MNLGQTRIGFPVLRIRATVFHATPRPPTAIERIVLKLCERFGANPSYNSISLVRIFEDILCIADPAPVLAPTLQELVMLDVLQSTADYSAVDTLALRNLEITARGRQMLTDDMLPARPQQDEETYLYDPIRRRLLSGAEAKTLRPASPRVALNAEGFADVFPEEQIREDIQRNPPSWWTVASRIERIERGTVDVQWREIPAQVALSGEEIRILLKDADYSAYIAGLGAQELLERILTPSLLDNESSAEQPAAFPVCRLGDLGDKGEWITFPQAVADCQAGSRIWCLNGNSGIAAVPERPRKREAVIRFGSPSENGPVSVTWNADGNGCEIHVGNAFPLDDVWLATDKHRLRARRVPLRLGNDTLELPLIYRDSWGGMADAPSGILSPVAEMLRTSGLEQADLAPAIWMSEAEFWRNHCLHLLSRPRRLPETLQLMQDAKQTYIRVTGGLQQGTWDSAVSQTVVAWRPSDAADLGIADLEAVLVALAKCQPLSETTDTNLRTQLMGRISPPSSLEQFGRIVAALRRGSKTWQTPYPSILYQPSVLSEIFKCFGGRGIAETLQSENRFDQAVRGLEEGYRTLNAALGGGGVASLPSDEGRIAVLKSKNTTRLAELAEAWNGRYRAFIQEFSELREHVQGSPLVAAAEAIAQIPPLTRKLVAGIGPHFRAVFVLDTSAILDRPSLIGLFKPDEYIVVSKRVIEELDDKKGDESLRPKVAQATRAINEFPKSQIQFCDGDMSLLPSDYRLKGDNLILSVAVKYRRCSPTLLTNDNNLALKAKAEGIATMKAEQFELLRRPPSSPGKKKGRRP